MTDTVQNIIDGLVIITETSCDPFDECATAPCGNHTCVNGIGTFTCVCSGEWSGTRCEVSPNYCLNHGCKHGLCVPGNGNYTCNCTDFYTGSDCSIPPLNGGWSSWIDWTACDVTCGGGTHSRQRLCVNPPPGPGGLSCDGDDKEIEECNTNKCPECEPLKRSIGTKPKCENDPNTADKLCTVSCDPGKTFPDGQEPYSKYKCGRTTGYTWQPFGKVPECVDYTSPFKVEVQMNAEITQNTTKKNDEDIKNDVSNKTNTMPCTDGMKCQVTVSISGSQNRRKRSTRTSIKLSYTMELPSLPNLDMAGYEQNATVSPDLQTLKDAFSAVEEQYTFFLDNAKTILNGTVDGVQYTVDPDTIEAFIGAYCNPGFSGSNGFCVECPSGTHEVDAVCQTCDVGTYQSITGQTTCEPCPTGYTTATYMATSIEECNVRIATTAHGDDMKQEKSNSKTVAIASSISSVVVVAGVIIIGAFCYKRFRKQARIARSKSLASLNMVRPEVVGSMAQFQMHLRGAEQANVRYIRENSIGCNSPSPSN
ncbi:neurogenic locus notch homolog protein 1-like [Dreissena polymorpha]|uniref:neurogenic locus notch homolog protein 1-like n=1 Tax=Dreissena polymorpha TaxID=45954 RepID=UPI002264D03B|nr:neurogenic locus notch homolog protein 1-like [Dreissena polymorpha]